MGASSNFGNMFSVLGASVFLPFVPMVPIQILTNNLLYDFSQTAIPTDDVDAELADQAAAVDDRRDHAVHPVHRADQLDLRLHDVLHHALRLSTAGTQPGALFQTGWFVESLLTQTLIIHVIRTNKIPFLQSRASWPLIVTSAVILAIGVWLTVSPLAPTLGFVALPPLYWLLLAGMLLAYMLLTQAVKSWFHWRYGD